MSHQKLLDHLKLQWFGVASQTFLLLTCRIKKRWPHILHCGSKGAGLYLSWRLRVGSHPGQVNTQGQSRLTQVSDQQFRVAMFVCLSQSLDCGRIRDWGVIITGLIHAPFILFFKSDFNKVRWNAGTDRVLFLLCGSLLPLRLLSVHRCQIWTVWVLGSLLLVQIKEICPSYKVPNNVPEVKVPQSAGNPERKHQTESKRKTQNDYSNLQVFALPLKTLPPCSSFFLLNHLIS